MGSQTLEILRQGVWASLTGGWFYDPHQGVFCNVVHLYLWLFLLCAPFVAYLYFPGAWVTWCIYCVFTSVTILLVKLANMALHRLYDRAQTMSDASLKNKFFKIIKESEGREHGTDIEMKVINNNDSRNSVEQAINEASEENSMISMENVNSIIDLKVDVHRKNSSESIELLFYPPSMISGNSQQDQQSIAGSNSVTKSIRSTNANFTSNAGEAVAKYLTVYPEHESELPTAAGTSAAASLNAFTRQPPHLLRKSSDDFKRRHPRRRLERQSSLDAAAESIIISKLIRNQSDSIAVAPGTATRNETFLHSQTQAHNAFAKSASATKVGNAAATSSGTVNKTTTTANTTQRLPTTSTTPSIVNMAANSAVASGGKSSRLQRHRSSETHEERLKHQNRGILLPIYHEHHHVSSGASSSGALTALGGGSLGGNDELELGMGGSASGVDGHVHSRVRPLPPWILGSSSDVYIEDDSYTKSDLGIEQLDSRSTPNASISAYLQRQQLHLRTHQPQHRLQLHQHHHHHHAHLPHMRKDSSSTMSALQLPVMPPPLLGHSKSQSGSGGVKRRRHSNTSAFFKNLNTERSILGPPQENAVRRIKSTALEVNCPQPSVSNLTVHPNSVEAINAQQKIKNPQSALLPPPSKCLIRNQHLNLCNFSGSTTASGSSLNFGASSSDSTTALIEPPVYAIKEQSDEQTPEGSSERPSRADLVIADIDYDDADFENAVINAHMAPGGDHDPDDDAVDDVPVPRRRREFYDYSAESDVGEFLADFDEFKDFDDNLEHILNNLQQTHKQLDELKASYATTVSTVEKEADPLTAQENDDQPSTSKGLRERLHSTDSETDNNGSRSPLLSGKNWEGNAKALKKQKQSPHAFPPNVYENLKGEADSGCPSSDCEQVSASSKDMLLSRAVRNDVQAQNPLDPSKNETENAVEPAPEVSKANLPPASSKNLGAIPKVVKYREVDETGGSKETSTCLPTCSSQLHKRRSGSGKSKTSNDKSLVVANAAGTTGGASRTSSSNSSRSHSDDSFNTDLCKMMWLMQGGAVDERGRPANEVAPPNPKVLPPNMSTAHFQFYQDALQALNHTPANSSEVLSLSERIYYQNMRRSSRQASEPGGNSSTGGDYSHTHELPASANASQIAHPPIGMVVDSSSMNPRNVNNVTTLCIQGLINVINDECHSSQARTLTSNPATILNVDPHHIENYCDYWRPSCLLSAEKPTAPKSFYKYCFKCCGYAHEFKISMDRLELLALFDRDLHWVHILLSVFLCGAVSFLGATILQLGYYKDIFAFIFCGVIAGSQYSLVKSVQPDAASPIHGFNKTVAYSRAIYFCICGAILLLLEYTKQDYARQPPEELTFFGIRYSPAELTVVVLHIMYLVLLCFPLIFSLGLFPQVNTFLMYFLEQIDMHIFGGNATNSLLGSFFCVLRSILGIMLLFGPLYAALVEGRGTQYIVFSIFCAMLIPLGYHLSRAASDFSNIWVLIKTCIVSTYRDDDDDDELSAAIASPVDSKKQAKDTKLKPATQEERKHQDIEMSAMEKTNTNEPEDELEPNLEGKFSKSKASSLGSSSHTLGKTLSDSKKAISASNSLRSVGDSGAVAHTNNNNNNNTENSANVNQTSAGELHTNNEVEDKTEAVLERENSKDTLSTSSSTNHVDISTLSAGAGLNDVVNTSLDNDTEAPDPLPKKLQQTVNTRLKNDLVVTAFLALVVFGLHSSTVFTVLQPDLNIVLYAFIGALGLVLHYIIPQMRKHMPWLCFARPLLRQEEYGQFEVSNASKVMWFEKVYIYLCLVERNVMFPLLVISSLTADAQVIANKFGFFWGTLIVAVCALKFIRNAYSDPTNQYLIILFTVLFFRIDFAFASETFLVDYFFVSIAFRKCCDFLLKLQFIVTYIAPWQITWGSAFHAFAQPFSVPHSAMLFLQAAISAILSTPLNPFLGSAIFLTSYVRPIKFWERDYNTRRIDHSNTRLSSQLERDLGADDNNLNSIFYEHLTRSLQHSLCGDLIMGRWGNVNQGDCFVLASDYLNCLVHIIELGNGLCTFQMRGLEFRGTYCQQREVEAITEDVKDNDGCCCYDLGHLPRMLSANAMFSTRWLAWQVVAAQYVLEGYSISDNLASSTLQVFEYRKVLITYYMKSIIYYVTKNPKLEHWLNSGPIQEALLDTLSRQFADLDPIFNYNLDEDFDFRAMGITRSSFCYSYLGWINFCTDKRRESQNVQQPATTPQATGASHNDSKSTPNLTTPTPTAQIKSQSQLQLQLRTRPQKSATMSGSATVDDNNCGESNERMASSQSFANISRQTSESAPGLTGTGYSTSMSGGYGTSNTASASAQAPLEMSFNMNCNAAHSSRAKSLRKETAAEGHAEADDGHEKHQPKLKSPTIAKDSPVVSLCLALGLLARRSLGTASHNSLTGVEFFLHGLHALFKGDFRITSPRDEWVFADMELLHAVVAPAVKMALKLQQDHISNPDEFLDPHALYDAIDTCSRDLVISHEADPVWRSAVLRGAPNLLALRHVMEDGSDEYRIIRLTKRFLSFRVIKLNRECVRGLWAGQQQELIYLRNRNPERGSIQNAKQALRNIINSSCDQPIGYPIYVSPLTTSYADTNEQLRSLIGGPITLESIKANVLAWWQHIRERCRQGCSSGSAMEAGNLGGPSLSAGGGGTGPGSACESSEIGPIYISPPLYNTLTMSNFFGFRSSNVPSMGSNLSQYGSDAVGSTMRGSLAVMPVKPSSSTLIPGLRSREREQAQERLNRNKNQAQTPSSRSERERRATLPSASPNVHIATTSGMPKDGLGVDAAQLYDKESAAMLQTASPRYGRISACSSNSLGIANIVTTPGDYPRKSKGPVCLTAASIASEAGGRMHDGFSLVSRKPRIELYKKVIIIDDSKIYDCLDLGRCVDVVWPNEQMRLNGGRLSWKDWMPCAGMVGYVVHRWIPNHADLRFRSHVNTIVYLIEIGERYVPVGEYGLLEYNQVMSSTEEIATALEANFPRSTMVHRQRHHEGLTPILGSSLESPTSQLAASTGALCDMREGMATSANKTATISAVSSSSSEDEVGLLNIEVQRRELLLSMFKLIAEKNESEALCAEAEEAQARNEAATLTEVDEAAANDPSDEATQLTTDAPTGEAVASPAAATATPFSADDDITADELALLANLSADYVTAAKLADPNTGNETDSPEAEALPAVELIDASDCDCLEDETDTTKV